MPEGHYVLMMTEIKEEINDMLNSKLQTIEPAYKKIRNAYLNPYDWSEIDILRHEACYCIAFSLNQAAITITNHMLESFLKYSITYKEANNNEKFKNLKNLSELTEYFSAIMTKYNSQNLIFTINMAHSLGIINHAQKIKLHEYRNSMRNAYSHADQKKMYNDQEISVQLLTVNTEEGIKIKDKSNEQIFNMPFVHSISQMYHAENYSIEYFIYLDSVIRYSIPIIFPNS